MTNDWHSSLFTGLFKQFGPMPARPHDPPLMLASGVAAPWLPHAQEHTASGIGWDAEAARAACVGEAIERLQCGPLPSDRSVRASFEAWPLHEPAIDPARWVLFHPEQYRQPGFPFEPLTRATSCDWVRFRQAMTGEPGWVPAELAYLHLPAGHRFCPGYSTGLAAGRVGDPILLRGLQEVIERDAVVGAWWGRYPLEEFDFSTALEEEVRRQVSRPNLAYRCWHIDTPFSDHVTMVALEGEDREGYCFSIGAACRATRSASWMKSLLEAIHGRHYVRYLKTQGAADKMMLGRAPRSFAEHAVYYSMRPEMLGTTVLARVARSPHPRPLSAGGERGEAARVATPPHPRPLSPGGERGEVARLIDRLGPDRPVLFRSMTPPGLASEELDWHVVRVVVPGLQPLHGDRALPHLGGELWAPRGLADWQTMPPHPFP